MRLGTAIECLVDNYKYASDKEWINDKVAWALYHTWKEADRKTEPQTIRCPKCGRTDYIRDMEKDMGIKGSHYKYKCINCNTYIKTEPTISKMEQVDKDINVRSKDEPQTERLCDKCEYYKSGEICGHPSIGDPDMGGRGDTFSWIKETPEWCPLKPQTERSE